MGIIGFRIRAVLVATPILATKEGMQEDMIARGRTGGMQEDMIARGRTGVYSRAENGIALTRRILVTGGIKTAPLRLSLSLPPLSLSLLITRGVGAEITRGVGVEGAGIIRCRKTGFLPRSAPSESTVLVASIRRRNPGLHVTQ